ncbi:unnamed protein product [Trichobilharzia szidati]|nr:unnamed protein product [Trichobilharzia szidati]CAH8872907.1 unnamed protein product [Trichobilharzia szidati]
MFTEHDQASNTLTTLKWNIKKTQEEYDRISTRLKSLNATKNSIESEISRLTGCTCLVNEKSSITEAELKEIIDKTNVALDTLQKTNSLLNETQIRFNAVKRRAEETRNNLASDVGKAEQNLLEAQVKLKEATEVEPKLIQETENMKNKIETVKNRIQVLTQLTKEHQQSFDQLKQQLSELNKDYINKQTVSENLSLWIRKNEENLVSQFNGKLNKEHNQLNQVLQKKSEDCYNKKMDEKQLQIENDRCEDRILTCQNEIAKLRKSIELLESRLTTAQDLLHSSNTDYNQTHAKHLSVTNDLELTKSRTRAEQDDAQNMLKFLQNRIEEESALRSKMMVDLERELQEYENTKQDGYRKRLELEETAKQLESAIENANVELEAVRLNHKYFSERLNNAQTEYKKFENQWNEEYSLMCTKIKTLGNSLTKSKTQASELKTRQKKLESEKTSLEERQSKIRLSLLALMKVNLRTTTKTTQLRCTIADLKKVNKTLKSEMNITTKRIEQMCLLQKSRELQQSNLMRSRESILKNLKEEFKEKLSCNLTLSNQYIRTQEEQSKLLSSYYLAVTDSVLDQNQLFNAELIVAICGRNLRQRSYWEQRLQAKQDTLVDDLLNQNRNIDQLVYVTGSHYIPETLSLKCKT